MAKILVVDDDLFIRELYVEVLKGEGYEVDAASNGDEGLAKLQVGGYDLVMLDVMMPKKDGVTVLKELAKAPPQTKNGPILLLTNLGYDPMIKEAEEYGAIAYLVKADLTPAQLIEQVKEYLKI